MVSLETNLFWN